MSIPHNFDFHHGLLGPLATMLGVSSTEGEVMRKMDSLVEAACLFTVIPITVLMMDCGEELLGWGYLIVMGGAFMKDMSRPAREEP